MKEYKYIFEYLNYWADTEPSHVALIYENQKITYKALMENSVRYACDLIKKGIGPNDIVLYMMNGIPDFFYLYNACSMIGAKLSGINARSPIKEINSIIHILQPRLMICEDAILSQININMLNIKNIYKCSDINYVNGELSSIKQLDMYCTDCDEENIVFIIFTSGTTGAPKGAMLSHKSILASVREQIKEFGAPIDLNTSDVIQHHVPVNHVSGAVQWGIAPLVAGSTIILHNKFNPQKVLECTDKYKATILTGVPAMWKMMFNVPDFFKYDLSSIRWCATGATQVNLEIAKRIFDICGNVSNPLGMTETSGFCTGFSGKSDLNLVLNTVGTVFENLKYKIIGQNECECEQGIVGQIVYKGDSVISHYFEQDLPLTSDGYFLTGDLCYQDEEKKIHLCGRLDDMFTVGGYNVYPSEIENIILQIPEVEQVVVVPIPHKIMGAVCRAYIVPRTEVDLNIIRKKLENEVIYYKVPREIVLCKQLPCGSLGKVLRKSIINQIQERL